MYDSVNGCKFCSSVCTFCFIYIYTKLSMSAIEAAAAALMH